MPYAVEQDFIDAFGFQEMVQITNLDTPSATTINSTKLTQAESRAEGVLNSYISANSAIAKLMPFSPPYPEVLKPMVMDIARYFMDTINPRDDVRLRYEDVIKVLKAVQEGKQTLGLVGTSSQEVISTSGLSGSFDSRSQIFNSETLNGY